MYVMKLILLVSVLISTIYAAIGPDEIKNLPGLEGKPHFRQYSGYLNATGTVKLHYWFVESAGSFSDPVVVWLNGGPGCSSMDGLLSENGPFTVQDDGITLKPNPYSWNKIAHMLYIEAPAGVGYSYSHDKSYATDDDQVSLNNYEAIKFFFKYYPEYKDRDFYITGESYGGIYVPTLSERVVQDSEINFKGMAIGNGVTDYSMLDNSIIYFGYYHGLYGNELWFNLVDECCVNGNSSNCNFYNNKNRMCQYAVGEAERIINSMNIYNLYGECYGGVGGGAATNQKSHKMAPPATYFFTNLFSKNDVIQHEKKKYLSLSPDQVDLTPPCVNATGMTNYMNNPKVRQAIHIPGFLPRWTICSSEVGMKYRKVYTTMRDQYLKILSSGDHRILVYNGDVDMACNFLGDEWFTDSLQQPVEVARRPWYYTVNGSKQVAGFVKQFRHLTYLTVKGSGHMVPQDKPEPAYIMFEHFIKDQPF